MNTERGKRAAFAVNVGLITNVILSLLRIWVGLVGRSPALLADGIHSVTDVAYNVIVKVFVRLAAKPPDREHPYGHSQLEGVGSVVVGCFIITAGLAILWSSVGDAWVLWKRPSVHSEALMLTFWVAVVTAALKWFLARYTIRLGKEIRNPAVHAIGLDHRSDVLATLGVAVGIFFGRNGIPWADPLAAGFVALTILQMGISILRESSDSLLVGGAPDELKLEIRDIAEAVQGVVAVEEITVHRFGPYLIVNLTILVDGALTIVAGDHISTDVESALTTHVAYVRSVYVHCHPAKRGHEAPVKSGLSAS